MRRVLVLYWWHDRREMRIAVRQHLHALDGGPDKVVYVNAHRPQPRWLRYAAFDAVVLHATFLGLRWKGEFDRQRRNWAWIGELDCPKVALPQDEYNHAHVLDDWLEELGVDRVFSLYDEETRRPIYVKLSKSARFSLALPGYIDEETAAYCRANARPLRERSRDVVYRAGHTRYWLGSQGLLKQGIGDAVMARAGAHRLDVDVSTRPEDIIWGGGWLDFLLSGRAIVGVEGGSSVLDPRGEIQAQVAELLAKDPALGFDDVDARMPRGWDGYEFFSLSPRHLEAVVARTAQVLVEGAYSGALEPERHYIPVRRDLSNLDEALERLADHAYLEELTSRAYEEVYLPGRWTTGAFRSLIGEALGAGGVPSSAVRMPAPLRSAVVVGLRELDAAATHVTGVARRWDRRRGQARRIPKAVRRGRRRLVKHSRRLVRRTRGKLRRLLAARQIT